MSRPVSLTEGVNSRDGKTGSIFTVIKMIWNILILKVENRKSDSFILEAEESVLLYTFTFWNLV